MRAWAIVTVVVLRRPPNHLFVGSSCATLASHEELAVGRAIPRELLAQLGALEDTPGPTLGGKLQASQARASPPLQILAYSSSVGACNYCRCEQPVGSTMPPWEQTRWWQGRYTMTSNDCGCGWPGRLARGLKEVLPSANYHVTNHGRFRDPRAPMAVALLTSLYSPSSLTTIITIVHRYHCHCDNSYHLLPSPRLASHGKHYMNALSELSDPQGFWMPKVDVVILDYGRRLVITTC
jgi:hypothetical protein